MIGHALNIQCFNNEFRPIDGSYIIAKIKYLIDDCRYKEDIGIYIYHQEKNELENPENYFEIFDYSCVQSWIYLYELSDLML